MSYPELIRRFGFDRDPFATTNADEEDLLEDYFIEPPFFKAVYGDTQKPKSAIVFAPRGGGKTALKRRIELFSRSEAFLCVTYNYFPIGSKKLPDIDQEFHLNNIARLMLVAILGAATDSGIDRLSNEERHFLFILAKAHLSDLSRADLRESIAAVKNLSDKAKEMWNLIAGPIGLALNAALSHFGFKPAEMSKFAEANAKVGDFKEQINFLSRLALSFGFASTYVLIDKVDETVLTGNKASESLQFISPLISDLTLLETPNMGFKFFLWDLMADSAEEVTRKDRVKHYTLTWSPTQLKDMLGKRLEAYSSKRIASLAQIAKTSGQISLDDVVVALSGGSPRNIIRICKAMFDQQGEIDPEFPGISEQAVNKGIELIAAELAGEAVPANMLQDLRKLKRADFTVRDVYADVFRISQPAGISKVQKWQNVGAVKQIGSRQQNRANRPSYVFGVSSPIILKNIFSDLSVFEFFEKKVRYCSSCSSMALRDWDRSSNQQCHNCQAAIPA